MFSWGEQCRRGFRLRDATYEAKGTDNGVCYLDLGSHVTHLSEGLRVISFVKTTGKAFIIYINENKDGTRSRGKQKCVECKEKIRASSCTDDEVMLLTRKGQVLCFHKGNPRPVKGLSGVPVSQVSCGSQHSVALTKDGHVFTWGQNSRGQLGLGQESFRVTSPVQVPSLSDLPLVQVAAGGEHSFSLSLSGAVFGWGNNSCGQLGLGDTTDRGSPTAVHYLNSKKTCFISCGLLHTAVLTKDGAVFTFGTGGHGQLGHNSFRDELRPRLIAELLGSKVTQVACGRQHTLVMIESRRLFSFGCGDQGQLGHRGETHPAVPLPVHLPLEHSDGVKICNIFAGANCSFATCFSEDTEDIHIVSNSVTWKGQPSLEDLILKWTSGSQSGKQTKSEIHRTFSSLSRLNRSFLEHRKDKHFQTSANYCGLDLTAAERSFANLLDKANVLKLVEAAALDSLSALNQAPVGVEALRVYLLLTELMVVVLKHNKDSALADKLATAIHNLPLQSQKVLWDWHALLPYSTRKRHVEAWRDALSQMLLVPSIEAKDLVLILEDMYNINTMKTGDEKLPETTFSLTLSDPVLQKDVTIWHSTKAGECVYNNDLILCNYKFLMDLQSKKKAFDLDCEWTMKEHQQDYFNLFLGWFPQPYLHLNLKRASLVEDTFQQLAACSDFALRKPLIVHFDGDSKITEVYKRDLFHHLFLKIVSADSEMLMFNESQTLAWFPSNQVSMEKKQRFFLFGKLCGLALYNQCIIHLPFPLALFKKLLSIDPCLDDLTELSPSVGQSLQYVLNYEANVEDLYMYFTIDWDKTEAELDPSNPGKPVTNDNRQEFVDAYVRYVFTTSVQTVFEEFRRGFFQVCELSAVQLFKPEELRGVMVGSQNYDWTALKQNTVYSLEYAGHPTIHMFWDVFEELNEEQKKDFLWFLTGHRRAPIFGLGQIQMKVRQKLVLSGHADEHFPESLTCHSILELPLYSSKDIMRKRVIEAIKPETGFRT
ncbi:probable E3 ubiquitin-protein ligase HERC3 [Eucyclogobius newberryi]|uniref:probable E3 ubiquitin-protein ligase HERC3 n=1 Tax=Eucyclogobius newberryi TaxID=166745 RepID=UPI003B5BE15A